MTNLEVIDDIHHDSDIVVGASQNPDNCLSHIHGSAFNSKV